MQAPEDQRQQRLDSLPARHGRDGRPHRIGVVGDAARGDAVEIANGDGEDGSQRAQKEERRGG